MIFSGRIGLFGKGLSNNTASFSGEKCVMPGVNSECVDGSTGVTAADTDFTVDAYFPNAKSGDVMTAEVLKQQEPSWDPGGELQLLPLTGTQKDVTVNSELKTSVTYTKAEAGLVNVGDVITVVFSGATDSGIIYITLEE